MDETLERVAKVANAVDVMTQRLAHAAGSYDEDVAHLHAALKAPVDDGAPAQAAKAQHSGRQTNREQHQRSRNDLSADYVQTAGQQQPCGNARLKSNSLLMHQAGDTPRLVQVITPADDQNCRDKPDQEAKNKDGWMTEIRKIRWIIADDLPADADFPKGQLESEKQCQEHCHHVGQHPHDHGGARGAASRDVALPDCSGPLVSGAFTARRCKNSDVAIVRVADTKFHFSTVRNVDPPIAESRTPQVNDALLFHVESFLQMEKHSDTQHQL